MITISRLLLVAVVLSCILLTSATSYSQDESSNLSLYGGTIIFDNPDFDSVVMVEFPFLLTRSDFEFFQPDSSDSNWYGRIYAQVRLLKYDGRAVDSNSIYFSVQVTTADEGKQEGVRLFNNLTLLAKPGVYSARLTVIDVVSKKKGTLFYERIEVVPPRKEKIHIGGACLAYSISYEGENAVPGDRLLKNGYKVLVNPLRVFGLSAKSVYFYGELYNLQYDETEPSAFQLGVSVLREDGSLVRDFGLKSATKPGPSAVITEAVAISDWKEGKYQLRIIAIDESTALADTFHIAFQKMAPLYSAQLTNQPNVYDPYDELTNQDKVNLVKYILSSSESLTLRRLAPEAQLNFLNQFWEQHDPDLSTVENELRLDQIARYLFANENYSSNDEMNNGWLTDRGRIYMLFGPWDRQKSVDLPQKSDPFEVWYYYTYKEGAFFVFEDKEAFFDMTLIHSNVEGERFNVEWDEILEQLDVLEDF